MNIDDSLVVVNSRRENAIEELLPSIRPNIPTGEYITSSARNCKPFRAVRELRLLSNVYYA